jgi:ubiquitin-like-conjugating enzyme ATG10
MSPSNKSSYKQWPHLTEEEFELACAFFDQRYVHAKLGPTRQIFKIRSRRTLTTGKSHIEVLRLLQLPEDDGDLASAFERLSGGDHKAEDMEIGEMDVEEEEEDEVRFTFQLAFM